MSASSPRLCFVCEKAILSDDIFYHPKVNLPICDDCCGSESETAKVGELLEGLAEGLICGCI